MATTESLAMVQEFYIAYYGRPADPDGLTYWADRFDASDDLTEVLAAFGESAEFTDNFGSLTATELVNNLYQQMFGRDAEAEGLTFYTELLESEIATLASIAKMIVDGASGDDVTILANKVTVAQTYTDAVTSMDSTYESDDIADAQAILDAVDETDASVTAGNAAAEAEVASNVDVIPGETFTLTNGTDIHTANIFDAPMVYTPDGSDRILSLQDEDVLTGTAGRADNTLNAVMGMINADEGSGAVRTPTLNNIQTLNLDFTGTTNTFDARFSDDLQTINVNKVTSLAANVAIVTNITTAAANLRVADSASAADVVVFNYQRGVLDGDETANIQLDDVLAAAVIQNALGAGAGVEGFETVNLDAVNGVDINTFSVNETENLTITGDSYLDVVLLTETVPALAGVTAPEFSLIGAAGGFINNGAPGFRTIDASAFTGDLSVDVTNAMGGFSDPDASGTTVHTVITGGLGDDTFWSRANIASTTSTLGDVLDAGAGTNKLVSTASITTNAVNQSTATITNIQSLELRQQGGVQTADLAAFDSALTNVMVRDENPNGAAAAFTLNNMLDTTDVTLHHGVSEFALPMTDAAQQAAAVLAATTVNVNTDDASGAADTVTVNVINDLNTGTYFNYTLNIDGDSGDGDTILTDGAVENVVVIDNDTESNILTLTKINEHTGTVTLTSGESAMTGDLNYTVAGSLIASEVDASAQVSNLRLTVGDTTAPIATITQDIKLGTGDDILTFGNINDFDATDTLTDAGGNDVVRAAFSKDSTLDLSGIEGLHIVANANVTLGMAKAEVDTLVIMSDGATDQLVGAPLAGGTTDAAAEPFAVIPLATNIITLSDTALTDLNFFADLDTNDDKTAANVAAAQVAATAAGAAAILGTNQAVGSAVYKAAYDIAYKVVVADEDTAQVWNGVKLANNTATDLNVNINSSLDDVVYGATAYTTGKITAHGVTGMTINVTDEDTTTGIPGNALIDANAQTTIGNIFAKNMTSLTVNATDNVNLGLVSGAALNNSVTALDATNVGGIFDADVISLGDAAKVDLGVGDNIFSAINSAGKNIVVTAQDGDNWLEGTAQSDTITTGSGSDLIRADRGDNLVGTGAGNDIVLAKDGADTVDLGTGTDYFFDNVTEAARTIVAGDAGTDFGVYTTTGYDASGTLNTVAKSGGTAAVLIDVVDPVAGAVPVYEVDQMIAVGDGSDLTVSWNGAVMNAAGASLDGSLASVDLGTAADANANLEITTVAALVAFNGLAGNDVYINAVGGASAVAFTGGTGNDAAVGGIQTDSFNGGTGADVFVMQNTLAVDGNIDTVIIADGDSLATAWDTIAGFDIGAAVSAAGTVAAVAGVAGSDCLDLDVAFVAQTALNAAHIAALGAGTGDVGTADIIQLMVLLLTMWLVLRQTRYNFLMLWLSLPNIQVQLVRIHLVMMSMAMA
jgi:hypothetical protein